MLRHPGHPCLCLFHARAESQLVGTENFGSELAQTISGDFMTATDINYAMGRLYILPSRRMVSLFATPMLSRASAASHARHHSRRQNPVPVQHKVEDWNKILDATEGLLPAPATPPAPSSQEPARRSHIHHSNTTQTRHSERREESLFAGL